MTTINGTAGNDTITIPSAGYGYQSAYTIYGGDGADRITVSASYVNTLYVYGGNGGDIIQTGAGGSNIVHGEGGNDTITATYSTYSSSRWLYGDDGNDTITGTADTDYIYGGNDNDTITGVSGADHLFGEAGNDTFIVKSTSDYVYYDGGTGTDTISVENVGTGFLYNLLKIGSLDSIEVIQDFDFAMHNSINPTFIFGSGLNLSNITLKDIKGVQGDSGDNVVKGGISVDFNTGAHQVMTLQGLEGNDTIKGYSDPDKLEGGEGNDDLFGLGGDDTLNGGAGSDKFHFDALSGNDVIEDFEKGSDLIYVHMTGLTSISGLQIIDDKIDTYISMGNDFSIKLEGKTGLFLSEADFAFVETSIIY